MSELVILLLLTLVVLVTHLLFLLWGPVVISICWISTEFMLASICVALAFWFSCRSLLAAIPQSLNSNWICFSPGYKPIRRFSINIPVQKSSHNHLANGKFSKRKIKEKMVDCRGPLYQVFTKFRLVISCRNFDPWLWFSLI